MAEAIRPGGAYQVGGQWVDADGRPTDAPTRKERASARAEQDEAERLVQAAAQQEAAQQQQEAVTTTTRRTAPKSGGEG